MYFNIATNNLKKSFKDYAIYFITLTLAVSIFYNFNSMNSQTVMQEMDIDILIQSISYISIFISVVFGGLVIYANNALVKKRKKEFGIYATLGMSKRKVSKILTYETFIVGIISLGTGLLLGVILSQGISVIIGKLFEFNMDEYKFILSTDAIIKTIIYFGTMFILVMVFNIVVVSKHKLIDLINASKKSEEIKTRNSVISVIIFILSIAILSRAYYLGWKFASNPKSINFPLSIIFGGAGTLLFFFGLAGFTLFILKKNKQIYLKKLNIFVIKQFSNKINTNFISMGIICLMLFVTIVMSSSSLSVKAQLEEELGKLPPFDANIEFNIRSDNQEVKDIEEALKKVDFKLRQPSEYAVVDIYSTNIKVSDFLNEYANERLKERLKKYVGELRTIGVSQYNAMRKLKGDSIIELKENEVLLLTKDKDEKQALNNLINNKKEIIINENKYSLKIDKHLKDIEYNLIAIVPDFAVENMTKSYSTMHINSLNEVNKQELEEDVKELRQKFANIDYNYDELLNKYGFIIRAETKTQMYNETKNAIGTSLYIGMYLGFVFLIASAAVLAIQQLTEASDSSSRYKTLKKIGVSDNMINKTIFTQILIHFMAPLMLAISHSIMALIIVGKLSRNVGLAFLFKLGPTILITGIIVIGVYGSYLYAAYTGYKNIIKNS
ncbi:FtsX-like permease family protein [Maledivibacter halophilus]|uniref:Putative ABC transport system permease protein n=1 Tax=Maledivibacter halophilus TaxID=36842 RepID=A0A1T5LLU2_9FIRM|nr:ABC transporter permease [Maledivibacter halophilus]SKC76890.1 putative ABC transport system permease protein [Maledivibacter halophilus]